MPRANTRRRLLVTLLCLLAGPLLAEGVLRFLLFGQQDFGSELRDAGRFARPGLEEAYYKLDRLFQGAPLDRSHRFYDPRLGWLKEEIDPATYGHSDLEGDADPRRLVLLYGASFAACKTEAEACWAQLVESSPLGERFRLVNYGVHAFGLDQMLLLIRASIDAHADRDPLIVVMPVVPGDLSRARLELFSWLKPKFELDEGSR